MLLQYLGETTQPLAQKGAYKFGIRK